MGDSSSSPTIIGVQSFRQNQILDKRRTLMLRKNTYNNLDTPSVVLNTKITAFISGKQLKFRSFHATRSIFDLTGHFRDATDDEIKTFANQTSVNIPDVKKFIEDADEVVRKKIYLIKKSGVLNNYKTKDLERAGKAAGVSIAMSGKAITFPDDKKQLKELLNFLDHGVYKSPISGDRFLANSKRKI
ncbi:Kiwa anti-phage protein KwaB-like domain-containing protein [Parvularcula lutaonensis]|uniref:Kiwa anti-phage protein KwaB-like domain-containing protein n=1 Tax=Parvularcula lutaonensis TaxID=491923 RepID=A0ABV7MC49_9PROT